MKLSLAAIGATVVAVATAQPAPPHVHYPPDRTYHLVRISADLSVDADRQRAEGTIVDTFTMLRNGITSVHFDTSAEHVRDVLLDGKPTVAKQTGGSLEVTVPASRTGETHRLSARIEGSFFRWCKPTKEEPAKIGFVAEGLPAMPLGWSPPNDLSSTEMRITVPAAWTVIANGALVSDRPAPAGRHTVDWKCDLPHAGYLNCLAVGPFDVRHGSWRGKPLVMTCPKGMGDRLDSTFAPTKDILDFYSNVLDFPYPWAKYGQEVVYDHDGYAEEDVSATEYPVNWGNDFLTSPRDGMNPTAWVIAHETAHQWFGDTVTCRDWNDTWLNEGMATFMEMMYTRHSRGELESLREVEAYSQRYFASSRTDFRPVATNFYSDTFGMGGWTTYMKGGTTLNSLREQIGDDAFYRGLHRYLVRHQFANVESNDLCEDMSEASGFDLHPWFDQWIYKPGHPVIDWNWSYDPARKVAVVHVRQTQDTSKGTPVYDIPTHVAIVTGQGVVRSPIHLSGIDQAFDIPSADAPKAMLFDPDHEFLRDLPRQPWGDAELPYVFLFAPNPTDMETAMHRLLGNPSDETIRMIAARLRADLAPFPAIRDTSALAALKRDSLHAFWVAECTHPNYDRRMHAARGLAAIASGSDDLTLLHALLGKDQPYAVVAAALEGLARLDFPSVERFAALESATATFPDLRRIALAVMAGHKATGWDTAILATAAENNPILIRQVGLDALGNLSREDARVAISLRNALGSGEPAIVSTAIRRAGQLRQVALVPDLQRMKEQGKHAGEVDAVLKALAKPTR